jgi:hypothetical protein
LTKTRLSKNRRIALVILIPLALALHVWLIRLGGVWRTFALVEAAIGVFLALLLRDIKKLNGE